MILNCLVIGAGGAIGAIMRYLISLIPFSSKTEFPYATFITNILGALLIGMVVGLTLQGNHMNDRLALFLRVGICGGFTTFSTFALETTNLMSDGKTFVGMIYVVLSLVLSVVAVMAGEALVK